MNSAEIGATVLTLAVLLAAVHAIGYLFERLRQPRLIGEILTGALFGPFALGRIAPAAAETLFGASTSKTNIVLSFIYWLGLMLLMFVSGSQARNLMAKENRRETNWLLGVGTSIPFFLVLGVGFAGWMPLDAISGTANQPIASLLVLSIAVAVTSIPVISRIFHDLGILHTRFASLILGAAVLEDIILWGVLAVATALVAAAPLAQGQLIGNIATHVGASVVFMVIGLTLAPLALRRLNHFRFNLVMRASPVAYVILVMLAYGALAAALDVTLVFAAFLAGYGIVGGVSGSERPYLASALEAITKFSTAFFVPIYFLMVGYKLDLGRGFSLGMVLVFLIGSSLISLLARGVGSWLAGFNRLDIVNLAVASNARGGPGIVLATVAYEAGIINAPFYTTLVLTAILTSQAAGVWLNFVLRRGWPLLSTNPDEKAIPVAGHEKRDKAARPLRGCSNAAAQH